MQTFLQYLRRFLANAKANPKTTAGGIAGVIGCIASAVHDPAKMITAEWWTVLFVSGTLIIAADQQPAPIMTPKESDDALKRIGHASGQ